jgi:sec-independent protein translocase protein TatA
MLGFESPSHIIIVLLIALVVFGPKRLPEMGRSLGQGIRQFKSSLDSKDAPETEAVQQTLPPAREAPVATPVSTPVATPVSGPPPGSGATPR